MGKELGKLQWEIAELTPEELAEWLALFDIQNAAQEKAIQAAKAKGKSRR